MAEGGDGSRIAPLHLFIAAGAFLGFFLSTYLEYRKAASTSLVFSGIVLVLFAGAVGCFVGGAWLLVSGRKTEPTMPSSKAGPETEPVKQPVQDAAQAEPTAAVPDKAPEPKAPISPCWRDPARVPEVLAGKWMRLHGAEGNKKREIVEIDGMGNFELTPCDYEGTPQAHAFKTTGRFGKFEPLPDDNIQWVRFDSMGEAKVREKLRIVDDRHLDGHVIHDIARLEYHWLSPQTRGAD